MAPESRCICSITAHWSRWLYDFLPRILQCLASRESQSSPTCGRGLSGLVLENAMNKGRIVERLCSDLDRKEPRYKSPTLLYFTLP